MRRHVTNLLFPRLATELGARLVAACLGTSLLGGAVHAAAEAFVPGEVLVQLRSGTDLPAIQSTHRLALVSRFGQRPIFRFSITGPRTVNRVVNNLRGDPRVAVAEANLKVGAPEARKASVWAVGNPSAYTAQWAPGSLGLPAAHLEATGQGLRVAVLDTGIDRLHPALAGRLLPGWDFVDGDADPSEAGTPGIGGYGHGTHVAGLVALAAPGAQLMPLRVLDASGEGNIWVLAEAMLHAVDPDRLPTTADGARVINVSLGTTQRTAILGLVKRLVECSDDNDDNPNVPLDDPGYADDRERCNVNGSAVVLAAAGNSGSATEKQFPAAEKSEGTLAIAASTRQRRLARFSNYGSWVDVAAPGQGLTSTVPGGGYGIWSGTSMATPLVAGIAALLLERNPDWKPEDVTKRLIETAVGLCGTSLRQVHAQAALFGLQLPQQPCPSP